MKKIFSFAILFHFIVYLDAFANNDDSKELKKFSVEYFKCKGNIIKDKSITTGKNIIKDTKDYQKKEWSKEKEKMNKLKEKINKTKDKVLNQ